MILCSSTYELKGTTYSLFVARSEGESDKQETYFHSRVFEKACNFCSRKAKLEKLKRRGKGPPPKGQGKRASKAKKK
jgi:hypothetical protein